MLTVIFATHNGATTLPVMLSAFCNLIPPFGGWRLVAVDNASTDKTLGILREYQSRLPLTILECNDRGKNKALNVALKDLEGDLTIFTDDDVIPRLDWLSNYRQLADSQPDFDVFGGEILPHWEEMPPSWLLQGVELGAAYAITPSGLPSGPIKSCQIWGPNMAVRSRIFTDLEYRFNESVGPTAGQYVMGSESDLTLRLEQAGHKSFFSTDVVVQHMIPREHGSRRWLAGRAFRAGRGSWFTEHSCEEFDGPMLFNAPRYLYRTCIRLAMKKVTSFASRDMAGFMEAEWRLNRTRGMIFQARYQYKLTVSALEQ